MIIALVAVVASVGVGIVVLICRTPTYIYSELHGQPGVRATPPTTWEELGAGPVIRLPVAEMRRYGWPAVRVVGYIPVGLVRVIVTGWRWVMLGEAAAFRAAAIADPLTGGDAWLRQRKEQRVARKERAQVLGIASVVCLVAFVVLWVTRPWLAVLVALVAAAWLGWYGFTWRHKPRELLPAVAGDAPRVTYDAVIDALSRVGIAKLAKAIGDDPAHAIRWVGHIARSPEGRGTIMRADLPPGILAADVVKHRAALASALGRPYGAVHPSVDHEAHPGRLVLYVADEDIARAPQVPWPHLEAGAGDYFADVQIGTDPMGRPVTTRLDEINSLFGGQPGFGKTSGMAVLLSWSALDPSVEHWVFDLKGVGDWQDAAMFAARYAAGQDDETAQYVMDSLAELRREIARRADVLKAVPRERKPDHKVTRELADTVTGVHPLHVVIDEVHEICQHPVHGKKAGELLVACVRLGRAVAVHVTVATQRPDHEAIPTALRDVIAFRSCFRTSSRNANDMILGDGMRAAGIDAGQFTTLDKGIAWVIGATSHDAEPTVVRWHYLDAHDRARIFTRARALRQDAGMLRGLAAGLVEAAPPAEVAGDILTDVHAVTRGRAKVHTVNLIELLAGAWPGRYDGLTPSGLADLLRPHGIASTDVWDGPLDGGPKKTAKGYDLARVRELAAALASCPPAATGPQKPVLTLVAPPADGGKDQPARPLTRPLALAPAPQEGARPRP